jgi:aerobic C4-dicarboxylate transport protein
VTGRPFYRVLYVQVLIAVAIGIGIGAIFPETGAALKPLGDAFIKLVKMIIAPVIFCTVVTGIAGMTRLESVGRVGAKALGYFLTVSTLALIVGLLVANVIRPGHGLHIDPATLDPAAVAVYQQRAQEQGFIAFLLRIIPESAFGALASGEILQVLLVSVLFGFGLAYLGASGKPLYALIQQLSGVIFRVVHLVMKVAPLGALGAMAFTIGKYGMSALMQLAALVGSFYLTSLIFILGVLGLIARAAGFSILRLIRYLKGELLLVLGTSSSESALPALMERLEKAGVSRPVVGLVVPIGYSFNLDGTNIYMTMAALFIAQATDTPLSITDQVLLLLVAMVSSKGAAGVTGSGFVTLAATLSVVPNVPVAGMALILGVDRFMSECRALTNFIGNAAATIVVARWERELDRERLTAALKCD